MDLKKKLEILADAANYDASCASSGSRSRDSTGSAKAIGSTGGSGICHSYAPDGRCISLLKILMTNACIYDCHYCVNRRSSDLPRARFIMHEVVDLTLDFYKRNYIEGLFLSSGIIRDPDHTMEQVVGVARCLRLEHDFRGYIHLKTIPEASQELIDQAGEFADRISVNIELPTEAGLRRLAPEKDLRRTQQAMAGIRQRIEGDGDRRQFRKKCGKTTRGRDRDFAPAGQSTQMIVGADASDDRLLLQRADVFYGAFRLKRVYYSAFSPIPSPSSLRPLSAPPLIREHRLYQSDWLMRFYGFEVDDIVPAEAPQLDLEMDPMLSWALRHRDEFPVDVNRAERERLMRIPGIGIRSVEKILRIRRWFSLRLDDLKKLGLSFQKCLPFVETLDHHPACLGWDGDRLVERFRKPARQLEFSFIDRPSSVVTGEL